MKKAILCSLFVVFSLFLLVGCGKDLSSYAGTYVLEYSKYVGDSDDAKNTKEAGEIILNADGTGESHRNSTIYDIEWKINDNDITLTEKLMGTRIEYNGTLKDGKLDLFNGDKTNALTNETVYNKVE